MPQDHCLSLTARGKEKNKTKEPAHRASAALAPSLGAQSSKAWTVCQQLSWGAAGAVAGDGNDQSTRTPRHSRAGRRGHRRKWLQLVPPNPRQARQFRQRPAAGQAGIVGALELHRCRANSLGRLCDARTWTECPHCARAWLVAGPAHAVWPCRCGTACFGSWTENRMVACSANRKSGAPRCPCRGCRRVNV